VKWLEYVDLSASLAKYLLCSAKPNCIVLPATCSTSSQKEMRDISENDFVWLNRPEFCGSRFSDCEILIAGIGYKMNPAPEELKRACAVRHTTFVQLPCDELPFVGDVEIVNRLRTLFYKCRGIYAGHYSMSFPTRTKSTNYSLPPSEVNQLPVLQPGDYNTT
jgi:hypothetical protein